MRCGQSCDHDLPFLKGNVIRNVPSLVLENRVIPPSVDVEGRHTHMPSS